jgi:hypothetical protein
MFGPSERNWQRAYGGKIAHVWKPGGESSESFCHMVRHRESSLLIDANDAPKCKLCLKVLSCLYR